MSSSRIRTATCFVSSRRTMKSEGVSKLRRLRRFLERLRRGGAAGNQISHAIEVPRADFALMTGGGVAVRLGGQLAFLKLRVGGHASRAVAAPPVEHRTVQRLR